MSCGGFCTMSWSGLAARGARGQRPRRWTKGASVRGAKQAGRWTAVRRLVTKRPPAEEGSRRPGLLRRGSKRSASGGRNRGAPGAGFRPGSRRSQPTFAISRNTTVCLRGWGAARRTTTPAPRDRGLEENEDAVSGWIGTIKPRESMDLPSHTIHHNGLLARQLRVECSADLGVASSTLAFRRSADACAP